MNCQVGDMIQSLSFTSLEVLGIVCPALIWASERDTRDDFNEGWIWIYTLI